MIRIDGCGAPPSHPPLRAGEDMAHRIREAMRAGGLAPLGGGGKIVEADETYYGNVDRPVLRANKYGRVRDKRLTYRGTGEARF
jgi:hypothetical protein